MLARGVADEERTRTFARYSLIGALSTAAGALAAAPPDFLVAAGIDRLAAFRLMFYAYAALGVLGAAALSAAAARAARSSASAPLGPSRGIVYKLAALFSLDSFAGGFVVQSLLALWLFERFDLSLAAASVFFFWSSMLDRVLLSGGGAARRRIGLDQHDGVHPYPVEHLPDPRGVLAEPDSRSPAAGPLGAVADGRADAHLLRHGGGDAGRARRPPASRRCRAASPRPSARRCRRAAGDAVFRTAARRLRRAEDRYDLALLLSFRHIKPPEEMDGALPRSELGA